MASVNKLKFRVSASFFVLTFLMLTIRNAYFFGTYILAVVLHEFAHAIFARKYGYKTTEISLSAFGAVLYGEFEGVELSDEIKIALAGPICNLCLALLTVAFWWLCPEGYAMTEPFFVANLGVFVINLLPSYPLDGGRILFGVLSKKYGLTTAKKLFQKVGIILAFCFFALFVVACFEQINLTFGLFSIFLFLGATTMTKQNMYQKTVGLNFNEKRLLKGMELKTYVLSDESTVGTLLHLKNTHFLSDISVVDKKMNKLFFIAFGDIDRILIAYPLSTKLKDLRMELS